MSERTPLPPGLTRPPPSDQSTPRGLIIKGIAGTPGVAVGLALVVGDTKAAYARRHITSAQIEPRYAPGARRRRREAPRARGRGAPARGPAETNRSSTRTS